MAECTKKLTDKLQDAVTADLSENTPDRTTMRKSWWGERQDGETE